MSGSNPLQSFFRKAKFKLSLPSAGKWWPKDAIQLNEDGTVDVMSMTATDDVKFKASESSISGISTYDLIKSCVPNIKMPELVPSVDLDVLLLAIRRATYGDVLNLSVPVPQTQLTRKIPVNISNMLSNYNKEPWEEILTIENKDSGESMSVTIVPNTVKTLFELTKTMVKQQQLARKIAESDDDDSDKIDSLNNTIKSLSEIKVTSVIDCVSNISIGNVVISNPVEILAAMKNMDVEYFNAMQTHLDKQRAKFAFEKILCLSTKEELAAGAPASWEAELVFAQSDFFKNDE